MNLNAIDRMTFIAKSELGDRDLISEAVKQSKVNPSSYIQRQQTPFHSENLVTLKKQKQ